MTGCYYKVRQVLQSMRDCYYKVRQVLQRVTDFITKCVMYYKVRQLLQSETQHPSVDVYIPKNAGRIYLTSRLDLECVSFQILNLANEHVFRWFNKHYFCPRFEFVRQKGYQYDYTLFDLA